MNKLKKSKEIYDHIPIPKELDEVVHRAIAQSDKKRQEQSIEAMKEGILNSADGNKKKNRTPKQTRIQVYCRRTAMAAAALLIAVIVAANSSEALAMEMQKLPIVGDVIKLLTIRSYKEDDGDKKVSIEVPGVVFVGDDANSFSKEVNEKISDSCNLYAQEAQKRAEEYKEAFIETGGTEAEWKEHNIEIKVWYEIKSQTEDCLSFVVSGTESWTSAYAEIRYYNLDLKNLQYLSLKDVLGDDYIKIANESIKSQIDMREKELEEQFFTVDEGGFQSIQDDTRFYMNEKGNPVIVFQKYEIGPGSMGEVEFEIGNETVQTDKVNKTKNTAETAETVESGESEGLNNFDVDKKEVIAFAAKVKEAVSKKDISKLADLVSYPTYVGFSDEGLIIENKEDFIALDQEKIFTKEMLSSIEAADAADLEASMAGFTLAKGYEAGIPSVTFSVTGGKLGITGINY